MSRALRRLVPILIPVVILTACATRVVLAHPGAAATPQPAETLFSGHWHNGVAVASLSGLPAFDRAAGESPAIVQVYYGFGSPFPTAAVDQIIRHGARPMIMLNPRGVPLSEIAAGRFDVHLRAWARQAAAVRQPVAVNFGHEMNGDWFSWGYRHTSPQVFVAAWRHIVRLFRQAGARNVIWVWIVNIVRPDDPQIAPIAPWWPGSAYVTWVGIDGYLRTPTETFAGVFGDVNTQIRSLTLKPVLVTETGVGPSPAAGAQIANLFSGARAYGFIGLVYFDIPAREDWRLQDDPPALAAFRKAVRA
jgi:hypothetical protein